MSIPDKNPMMKIRPATAKDVKTAAPLIYSSGPAAFDFVFKRENSSALGFLSFAFVDGGGEFGYKNHVAIEIDEQVVGIGSGYGSREASGFTLPMARQIMKHYGLVSGLGVIKRGLQIEQVIEPPKGKVMHYIAHLGVAKNRRSQGIGTQLVAHLMAQGRQAGRQTAVLDVAISNLRAKALYERLGFVVTRELVSKLSNEFGSVINLKRMERSLS